jgi:HlyD family secretion protein
LNRPIFRKVSLDRLSSPEQLDQLMQITDTRGWVTLSAFGVILVTATIWGILGRIPEDVTGMGILVKSGGVFEVIAVAGGRMTDIAVSVGDVVTEGQVVARMSQPEIAHQLLEAKAELAALKKEQEEIVSHGSKDEVLEAKLLREQRATEEAVIAAGDQGAKWFQEKVGIQEKLVQEGLLTKQTLLTTRQQLDDARGRVNQARSQLSQIAVKELDLRHQREEDVRNIRYKIEEKDRARDEIERNNRSSTEIVAQQTGRILEIMTEQGAVVNKGQAILTLDLTGRSVKALEAVIFVPSIHGKQIKVGMLALVAPSTVKQEEFGLMLGRVTYVSDFPATPLGMRRVLKNDKLVTGLAGTDAPYEIHADLLLDLGTASGFKWSSSKGPPLQIQSGTLGTARITVASRRPIEMVIPLFREYTGL